MQRTHRPQLPFETLFILFSSFSAIHSGVLPPREKQEGGRKEKALKLKALGNDAYTNKDYAASVKHYTYAIDVYPDQDEVLSIFYGNRAAANLQLNEYAKVVEDCTQALKLQPGFALACVVFGFFGFL
jgi:tetratricopeptide (TPR) repeat protein